MSGNEILVVMFEWEVFYGIKENWIGEKNIVIYF